MSIKLQMEKECYVYSIEYYLAMKENELVIHTTMWMNLKNMMQSERRQTEKTRYYMIAII